MSGSNITSTTLRDQSDGVMVVEDVLIVYNESSENIRMSGVLGLDSSRPGLRKSLEGTDLYTNTILKTSFFLFLFVSSSMTFLVAFRVN